MKALRGRLDPGSKATAAQDFRHTSQGEGESVSDFIRRIEKMFQLAYGGDGMQPETRGTLLYGQLQEGLHHNLMEGPAVSGTVNYQVLCVAAKMNSGRRLKRRLYQRSTTPFRPSQREEGDSRSKLPDARRKLPKPAHTRGSTLGVAFEQLSMMQK